MQLVSDQIAGQMQNSSWIRKMFETGMELKKEFGADRVFDFSLGNPDLPPPPSVAKALHACADGLDQPLALGYMPNGGYPEVRAGLAAHLAVEQQAPLTGDHVIVTCGAAGGINVFFRAVLQPGDEVVCPAPYFVEYGFYAGNYGGVLRPVKSRPLTFELDLEAIDAAITPKTRAVIVNSPNNPTGCVYSKEELQALVAILEKHTRANGRPVFLVSDEPYRFLTYDDTVVEPILPLYEYSIVIGSFSKNLALAGERVGYIAANPGMGNVAQLVGGMIMTNRVLGFVSAPALGQKLMLAALGSEVDISIYRARRDAMAKVLADVGIEFSMPRGAFYFFPKAPGGMDDKVFVDRLMENRVLAVPGAGFGYEGYFRLTFCLDQAIIERSAEGFQATMAKL
ncbi:MAG: pyridoxal phosphate-dependent aminotransferase [Lentisphaeria bacterium]|nr:pyridoxal phosphate-dependent aminotransferase [Lentisphaeria bacterium]